MGAATYGTLDTQPTNTLLEESERVESQAIEVKPETEDKKEKDNG